MLSAKKNYVIINHSKTLFRYNVDSLNSYWLLPQIGKKKKNIQESLVHHRYLLIIFDRVYVYVTKRRCPIKSNILF